jgi:hypothetical protein
MTKSLPFSHAIDNVLSGNAGRNTILNLGNIPKVYLSYGLSDLQLAMTQGVLRKIISKHNLSINLIKQLPYLLEEPVMILQSATEVKAIVSVLNAFDCKNSLVIAAIHPDKKHKQHKVNLVTSVYGKARIRWFEDQIKKGNLLYLDKEKALQLSRSTQLQLPREVIAAELRGILPFNQSEVKNNQHYNSILTLKNKGDKDENK